MKLLNKAKNLPLTPGVYIMKDSLGHIIYVGKSKKLRNRVSSYFLDSKKPSKKVEALVANVKDFDYIETDTEFEALLLECQLIKQYKPRYNRMMKNSKAYHYIAINMEKDYPSLDIILEPEEKKSTLYFGPYPNKYRLEDAVSKLIDYLGIHCKNLSKRNSPCFNYSIGKCHGICIGEITYQAYKEIINKIVGLLAGNNTDILDEIEWKMEQAAQEFDFETAAKLRDTLAVIEGLVRREKMVEFAKTNQKMMMIESLAEQKFKIFYIQGNSLLYSRIIPYNQDQEALLQLIEQDVFQNFERSSKPKQLNKDEVDQAQIIYHYVNHTANPSIILKDKWLDPKNCRQLKRALSTFIDSINGLIDKSKNTSSKHAK